MFNEFKPVLNDFELSSSRREDSESGDRVANPCAIAMHFQFVAAALEQADLVSRVNSALEDLRVLRTTIAIAELSRLRDDALDKNDPELAEVAAHNLSVAYRQIGELNLASSWQQQSIAWRLRRASLKRAGDEDDELGRLACDLTSRGSDEFLRGRFDLAESFWRRALAIEEWRGNLDGQAIDCGNLGLLAAKRGDLESGVRWLRKSHRMHRLMFDLVGSGQDLMNLAELFRLLGEYRRSTSCLRRAVRSFERSGAKPLLETARSRLREALRTEAVVSFDARLN